jgi:hypothetical protein
MRKVIVKHIFKNEIVDDYSDIGVFYEDRGIVISCDPFGLIEVFNATPVENSDIVLVEENANCLATDNPVFPIELILGGNK